MQQKIIPPEELAECGRMAQLLQLVKENQLLTAAILFVLWQTGSIMSAASYIQGGIC